MWVWKSIMRMNDERLDVRRVRWRTERKSRRESELRENYRLPSVLKGFRGPSPDTPTVCELFVQRPKEVLPRTCACPPCTMRCGVESGPGCSFTLMPRYSDDAAVDPTDQLGWGFGILFHAESWASGRNHWIEWFRKSLALPQVASPLRMIGRGVSVRDLDRRSPVTW